MGPIIAALCVLLWGPPGSAPEGESPVALVFPTHPGEPVRVVGLSAEQRTELSTVSGPQWSARYLGTEIGVRGSNERWVVNGAGLERVGDELEPVQGIWQVTAGERVALPLTQLKIINHLPDRSMEDHR